MKLAPELGVADPARLRFKAGYTELPRYYASAAKTLWSGAGTDTLSLAEPQLRLQSLQSADLDNPARLEVRAELLGTAQAPAQLERLVSRVSLEKGVSSVRWQLQQQVLAVD